jgi:hypothetical protein
MTNVITSSKGGIVAGVYPYDFTDTLNLPRLKEQGITWTSVHVVFALQVRIDSSINLVIGQNKIQTTPEGGANSNRSWLIQANSFYPQNLVLRNTSGYIYFYINYSTSSLYVDVRPTQEITALYYNAISYMNGDINWVGGNTNMLQIGYTAYIADVGVQGTSGGGQPFYSTITPSSGVQGTEQEMVCRGLLSGATVPMFPNTCNTRLGNFSNGVCPVIVKTGPLAFAQTGINAVITKYDFTPLISRTPSSVGTLSWGQSNVLFAIRINLQYVGQPPISIVIGQNKSTAWGMSSWIYTPISGPFGSPQPPVSLPNMNLTSQTNSVYVALDYTNNRLLVGFGATIGINMHVINTSVGTLTIPWNTGSPNVYMDYFIQNALEQGIPELPINNTSSGLISVLDGCVGSLDYMGCIGRATSAVSNPTGDTCNLIIGSYKQPGSFCDVNRNAEMCGCVNWELGQYKDIPQLPISPECWLPPCNEGQGVAYRPSGLSCPTNITVCQSVIEASNNSNINIKGTKFYQECCSNHKDICGNGPGPDPPGPPGPWYENKWLWIGVGGFLLVVFILIVVIVIRSGGKKKPIVSPNVIKPFSA